MSDKVARANVAQLRQTTQFTCCATSLTSAFHALGKKFTEDEVNKVLGAAPMAGATWEAMLATVQYFGCRGTLVVPATPRMLKEWTDQGIPVVIAWNPEGRPWSHASTVFDVTEDEDGKLTVYIMDPNIPNPSETVRVMDEDTFCQKWGEKVSDTLIVRRPAMAVELEVTPQGRQVVASRRSAKATLPSGDTGFSLSDGTFVESMGLGFGPHAARVADAYLAAKRPAPVGPPKADPNKITIEGPRHHMPGMGQLFFRKTRFTDPDADFERGHGRRQKHRQDWRENE